MAELPPPEPPVYPPAGPRWPPHPPTTWPPPAPPAPRRPRRRWMVLAAVVVVALLGLVAVRRGGDDDSDAADPSVAGPTTTGGSRLPQVTPPAGPPITSDPGLGGAGVRVAVAIPGEARSLNPHRAGQPPDVAAAAVAIANQVLPSAFVHQPDGTWAMDEAVLAAAEVTATSPFTVRYQRAAAATWSDGQPIGCADFLLAWVAISGEEPSFSPGREPSPVLRNPDTAVYRAIDGVECEGDEITVTFGRPVAEWRMLFAHLLPAHAVGAVAGVVDVEAVLRARDLDGLRPLGDVWDNQFGAGLDARLRVSGGPFVVTDLLSSGEVRLRRNERYAGPAPVVDGLVLRPFTDFGGLPSALARGDVQVAQLAPNEDVAREIDEIGGFTLEPMTAPGYVELSFVFPTFATGDPLVASAAVRRAVAWCIDRDEIVDAMVGPFVADAPRADSHLFAPGEPGYRAGAGAFAARDVDAARSELEGDGWAPGPDGVYVKDGAPLRLELVHSSYPREARVAELIQAGCADAGVDIVPRLAAGEVDYGSVRLQAWGPYNSVEVNMSRFEEDGLVNNSSYANPDIEPLFRAVRNGAGDIEAVADAAEAADAALWADAASVPLYPTVTMTTWDERLCGVTPNPTNLGVTWNAATWYLCDGSTDSRNGHSDGSDGGGGTGAEP